MACCSLSAISSEDGTATFLDMLARRVMLQFEQLYRNGRNILLI